MSIFWIEIYMLRSICGVHLKDRKRSRDLMLMMGLNESIDQLAMAEFVGMVMC